MSTKMVEKPFRWPPGTYPPPLKGRNADRHREGAARQVERAQAAFPRLLNAPTNRHYTQDQPCLWRYQEAVRLRVEYPQATLAELAAKMCMSKNRYWRILARALEMADKMSDTDDEEWVIFK